MAEILALRHEVARARRLRELRRVLARDQDGAHPVDEVIDFPARSRAASRPVAQREFAELTRSRAASSRHGTSRSMPSSSSASASSSPRKSCGRTSRCRACSTACSPSPSGCTTSRSSNAAPSSVWHPDVRFYDIVRRATARAVGSFYLDLYARPNKRGGAWMDECVGRKRRAARLRRCRSRISSATSLPPVGDAPSLLTHHEVVTLFHEFGHGLHHLLTRVDYPSIAGINGVAVGRRRAAEPVHGELRVARRRCCR